MVTTGDETLHSRRKPGPLPRPAGKCPANFGVTLRLPPVAKPIESRQECFDHEPLHNVRLNSASGYITAKDLLAGNRGAEASQERTRDSTGIFRDISYFVEWIDKLDGAGYS
jgi:hypothetical protein